MRIAAIRAAVLARDAASLPEIRKTTIAAMPFGVVILFPNGILAVISFNFFLKLGDLRTH
jgi:hypothetical protein